MQQRLAIFIIAGGFTFVCGSIEAQVTTTTEVVDGVTFQVTRRVVERAIPTTQYQTKEEKYYRPQYSTQYQTHHQTHLTPVTQYQYVPRLAGRWNPFVQPYWVYDYKPVTKWEARPATVQVPIAKTDWVEEKRTVQIPVTTYKTVKEEHIDKVALSVAPGSTGTAVASQATNDWRKAGAFGSQQLQNDPPAQSPYDKPATTGSRY